jgi:RNA polymerase-binding protein DksA
MEIGYPTTGGQPIMETLTSGQERKLKHELEKQRKERLAAAHEELLDVADQNYSTFAGEVPDEGDQAVAAELADFENARARRYATALREIDDALVRIDEHCFGQCIDCGDDIGYLRLSAIPTALRCVRCQEQHDRTYAHEARPRL